VPATHSYDFAAIRVVPRVDREEFVNAGVVVFCRTLKFLKAKIEVNEARLKALWPDLDLAEIRGHLESIPQICAGDRDGGPIAALPMADRFHWIVAPRSTMIQVSPVHSGICETAEGVVEELFERLVGRG